MAEEESLMRVFGRLLRRPLFWAVLLTIAFVGALVTQATPFLLGNEEWRWHARPPAPDVLGRSWLAVVVLVTYLIVSTAWIDGANSGPPPVVASGLPSGS